MNDQSSHIHTSKGTPTLALPTTHNLLPPPTRTQRNQRHEPGTFGFPDTLPSFSLEIRFGRATKLETLSTFHAGCARRTDSDKVIRPGLPQTATKIGKNVSQEKQARSEYLGLPFC